MHTYVYSKETKSPIITYFDPYRSSIILELVEPVPQVRRVLVEVDRDLAERVDPSCTLCLPIMILAVALLAAEIERHS